MKKLLLSCIATLCMLQLFATNPNTPEQLMVSYKKLYTYTQDSLERYWKNNKIPQAITKVSNAVDLYEITYKGLWLDSTYIIAKGAMYVPVSDKPMAEMVYCHGTRISVAQRYGRQDLEQFVAMMHAADGYIAYFPFYYGMGGGEKEHVYQHYWTEAMSVIHMIKACREILPEIGATTNGQLFVTGYSQGGHAAAATHKMIETGRFPDVQITASSPMSGAYDMTGTQSPTMFIEYDRPHYLPYLLISYDYAYKLWDGNVYEAFKPPFNTELKELFKQPRVIDYGYLDSILPHVPATMIDDSLVQLFRSDPKFPFTQKLAENNLYDWEPKAPIQLCACYGDNEVLYQNTEVAYAAMKEKGAPVHLKLLGKHLSHNPCAPFAIIYSKQMFDNMRKGRKNVTRMPFGKKLLLGIGIAQANKQAKRKKKRTGEVESDPLAARKKKK